MGGWFFCTYSPTGTPLRTAAACSAAPSAADSGSSGSLTDSWNTSATICCHRLFLLPPPTSLSSVGVRPSSIARVSAAAKLRVAPSSAARYSTPGRSNPETYKHRSVYNRCWAQTLFCKQDSS
eukprot:GHRR01011588.1.p1 GENE.GHRR01011588.1~~GHRR01011588.1.p1  ORF type:complete len:123 (-),score=27.48 GHRR01011588.1:2899-3267(-)